MGGFEGEALVTAGTYLLQSTIRILLMLFIAVFIAEAARLKLGDDRLKRLLSGVSPGQGRLRAAVLGALLPFCECGAFPVMLGLMRAGVSLGAILTFFIVSPVMSVPAFLILLGVFGPGFAVVYLVLTVGAAVTAAALLEMFGNKWGVFKPGFVPDAGCCEGAACSCENRDYGNWQTLAVTAGRSAWRTVRRVLPYALFAIVLATGMKMLVPPSIMDGIPAIGGRFGVVVAAAAGIPLYAGDCTMIAVVAPFMAATNAVGPAMAFMIAGSATSINGLVFMSSVFHRRFLIAYVVCVFTIAVVTGYMLSAIMV